MEQLPALEWPPGIVLLAMSPPRLEASIVLGIVRSLGPASAKVLSHLRMANKLATDLLGRFHERTIHPTRVRVLTDLVVNLARSAVAPAILDIGCGDGSLARATAARLGAGEVRGVDVKVRQQTQIPVECYDGRTLPFPSDRFDLVILSDVLHHAAEPGQILREAVRVLRPEGLVVVKDHFAFGPWSHLMLLAMDLVGNAPRGVLVRGRYFSGPEWIALVAASGGRATQLVWPLKVHQFPWHLLARNKYQFAMTLKR